MSVPRFYVGEGPLREIAEGDEIALPAEAAHRITHVLRLRGGDRVSLFGDGREFEAELVRVDGSVRARLLREEPAAPARCALTLYQALIRPNRFEWLIEKGTELGVSCFVPLLTDHTSIRSAEIGPSRFERWSRIAIEASEQCGRRLPPAIAKPVDYRAALAQAAGRRVFAWEGLRTGAKAGGLDRGLGPESSLFIGPEGGWSEAEVEAARSTDAVFLGLGPTVLRSETAAIAAISLLLLAATDSLSQAGED
jgi:16S rRNA (uracil1498-N3)-methyltransferase